MSDGPTVIRGAYTWHPIVYLSTLLYELQGALKPKKPIAYSDASILKYEQRLEKVAPRIIKMRAQGVPRKKISDELGIPHSTLTKYIRDIKAWELDK
jgi:DNA invertase Pin-like site-specific DNA recombinase